ncbi:MAG: hypothetical protein AAB788_03350, partial [Patescibacteria group bacterium]
KTSIDQTIKVKKKELENKKSEVFFDKHYPGRLTQKEAFISFHLRSKKLLRYLKRSGLSEYLILKLTGNTALLNR